MLLHDDKDCALWIQSEGTLSPDQRQYVRPRTYPITNLWFFSLLIDSFLRRKMAKKGGGSTVRVEDVDHTPPEVNHPNMAMEPLMRKSVFPISLQYRALTQ